MVLALEGRYETFTVGRDIEWEKVKEIYRLGLKHGMRLATISGVNGVFTVEHHAPIRGAEGGEGPQGARYTDRRVGCAGASGGMTLVDEAVPLRRGPVHRPTQSRRVCRIDGEKFPRRKGGSTSPALRPPARSAADGGRRRA